MLADYVGALKMGLDPGTSPTFERALARHPLPQRYIVTGSLSRYRDWRNVPAPMLHATRMRARAEALDRLIEPWLQCLDPAVFPLKQPLDARLNAALAPFFADPGAANQWLLAAASVVICWAGDAFHAYRTLFDKDALRRQAVPLGIDLARMPEDSFSTLVLELHHIEQLAARAPQVSDELRWRPVDESIVFSYQRELPIDYDHFVRCVDIARTIEFMSDYLGGVLVVLERDPAGRPIRQAERNIYLPQPNYLVLYQGLPIDVSKLEVLDYDDAGQQRLYWKTILSANDSAAYDDGVAEFKRAAGGTRVTITGRQQFTLPRFFQVFDPNVIPELKARLVTHAYQTFFDRTIANFEALVEGRDIRIGRPVDEPAMPPAEQLMPLLQRLGELAMPFLLRTAGQRDPSAADDARRTDADGFVHITPAPAATSDTAVNPDRWAHEIPEFVAGLGEAVRRDLARALQPA
jgi:hypothetical protein